MSVQEGRRGRGGWLALTWLALLLAAWSCSDDAEDPAGGDSGQRCVDSFECPVGELCVNGACTSDIELCDPEDTACLEGCVTDADCGRGERCNGLTGECMEDEGPACDPACEEGETCDEGSGRCIVDAECEDDGDCAGDATCEGGECVEASPECEADGDCAAGEVCEAGACEEAPEDRCASDAECGLGERCNLLSGDCEAIQMNGSCDTSNDCVGGQVCNRNTMLCETPGERCLGPQDCGAGEVCNTSTGACEPAPEGCTSDAQCATGEVCNTTTGVCEGVQSECASNADCAFGEECRSGQCRVTSGGGGGECIFSFECPVGQYCDFFSGSCAPGCGSFLDCGFFEDCVNNQCVPEGTCSSDFDCGFDEVCLGGQCTYAECFDDSDCPGREVCDPATASCVAGPPECTTDATCGAGRICQGGACVTAPECAVDADCEEGEVCSAGGACVPEVVSCDNDPAEPNDTFAQATPLAIGATGSGLLCGDELDAFRVTMVLGQCYQIQANFTHADGDVDLFLIDEVEGVLLSSEGASNTETINANNDLGTADYFVVLWFYEFDVREMNAYTVSVTSIQCQ
jgi:Cys-rich repeat protein